MTHHNKPADKWFTLPNVITTIRMLGSPGMIVLAFADQALWLGVWVIFLVFTEWIDGFLARQLKIASALGARLDTIADLIFYSCLLLAVVVLRPELVGKQWIWIAIGVTSYFISWVASFVRFGRLPSYHTWAAKGAWGVVGLGTLCLLAEVSNLPFQLSMLCVALTNLEAICITLVLPKSQVDVPTMWHAQRLARAGRLQA